MTSTSTTTEWALPVDAIVARHRARIEDHDSYIPFVVEAWIEGVDVPCLTTTVPEGDFTVEARDAMLHAARVMGLITGADYLVACFDSHASKSMINPVTGREWGPHEMQNLCDQQGFCETGLIRDELVVAIVRRSDAKIRMQTLPYHFHKGKLIEYDDGNLLDEWNPPEGGFFGQGGIVSDGLRIAVADRPDEVFDDLARTTGLHDDPAAMRLHMSMAAIKLLQRAAGELGEVGLYLHAIPAQSKYERQVLRRAQEEFSPQIVSKLVV